jgi:hypothetical protein
VFATESNLEQKTPWLSCSGNSQVLDVVTNLFYVVFVLISLPTRLFLYCFSGHAAFGPLGICIVYAHMNIQMF